MTPHMSALLTAATMKSEPMNRGVSVSGWIITDVVDSVEQRSNVTGRAPDAFDKGSVSVPRCQAPCPRSRPWFPGTTNDVPGALGAWSRGRRSRPGRLVGNLQGRPRVVTSPVMITPSSSVLFSVSQAARAFSVFPEVAELAISLFRLLDRLDLVVTEGPSSAGALAQVQVRQVQKQRPIAGGPIDREDPAWVTQGERQSLRYRLSCHLGGPCLAQGVNSDLRNL